MILQSWTTVSNESMSSTYLYKLFYVEVYDYHTTILTFGFDNNSFDNNDFDNNGFGNNDYAVSD